MYHRQHALNSNSIKFIIHIEENSKQIFRYSSSYLIGHLAYFPNLSNSFKNEGVFSFINGYKSHSFAKGLLVKIPINYFQVKQIQDLIDQNFNSFCISFEVDLNKEIDSYLELKEKGKEEEEEEIKNEMRDELNDELKTPIKENLNQKVKQITCLQKEVEKEKQFKTKIQKEELNYKSRNKNNKILVIKTEVNIDLAKDQWEAKSIKKQKTQKLDSRLKILKKDVEKIPIVNKRQRITNKIENQIEIKQSKLKTLKLKNSEIDPAPINKKRREKQEIEKEKGKEKVNEISNPNTKIIKNESINSNLISFKRNKDKNSLNRKNIISSPIKSKTESNSEINQEINQEIISNKTLNRSNFVVLRNHPSYGFKVWLKGGFSNLNQSIDYIKFLKKENPELSTDDIIVRETLSPQKFKDYDNTGSII